MMVIGAEIRYLKSVITIFFCAFQLVLFKESYIKIPCILVAQGAAKLQMVKV